MSGKVLQATVAAKKDQDGKAVMAAIMWALGVPLPFILLYWVACN